MRKKTGVLLIIVLALLIAAAGVYFAIAVHYRTHFFRNTTINGTNVSEMNIQQAQDALAEQADKYRLVITDRDEEQETITGESIDYHYVFGDELKGLLSVQNPVLWLPGCLQGKHTFEMKNAVVYDEKKLDDAVSSLSCMQEEKTEPPEDAYIDLMKDGSYGIVAETAGNRVDPEKMDEAVKTALERGRKSLNLDAADCYEKASLTADDEILTERLELMNQYASMVINYYISADEIVTLDGSTFMDWLSFSKKNKPEFDYDAVYAWVTELAKTYDTIGTMEPFTTSRGQTISVEAVTYGWQMDCTAEAEALCEVLQAGQTEGRSPIWRYTANARGENDVGDTYVEVDYTNQRMWYYKNGKLLVETPVVTGNDYAGDGSPEGMYFIYYKMENAILKGEGYETPVNYWMPFCDNVGIHDADSWRSSYGGTIYLGSGSHGCINTPSVMAEKIYENMEDGTPVICYSSGVDYGYSIESVSEISALAASGSWIDAGPGEDVRADSDTGTIGGINLYNDYTTETNSIDDVDSGGAENAGSADSAGDDDLFDIVISDEAVWQDGAPQESADSAADGTDDGIVIIE